MKTKRVLLGVVAGMMVLIGIVWGLSKTLGNNQQPSFHGKPISLWVTDVSANDVAASNQANGVLNIEIIPQLEDRMFHDTNDSKVRIAVVDALNGLPGVEYVVYNQAYIRRADAADHLGSFGPAARAAVPALMQAVQGNDPVVREKALLALGKIHSEPDQVIPLLTKYLDDDNLNDEAATALAEFGSLAKPAVPKIIPLLHAADDDAQAAALAALKKIDPAALTNALNEGTNHP